MPKITLSCPTKDAVIRYTVNGSNPTASSTQYTAPFTVEEGVTVKAAAYRDGWTASEISSALGGEYVLMDDTIRFDTIDLTVEGAKGGKSSQSFTFPFTIENDTPLRVEVTAIVAGMHKINDFTFLTNVKFLRNGLFSDNAIITFDVDTSGISNIGMYDYSGIIGNPSRVHLKITKIVDLENEPSVQATLFDRGAIRSSSPNYSIWVGGDCLRSRSVRIRYTSPPPEDYPFPTETTGTLDNTTYYNSGLTMVSVSYSKLISAFGFMKVYYDGVAISTVVPCPLKASPSFICEEEDGVRLNVMTFFFGEETFMGTYDGWYYSSFQSDDLSELTGRRLTDDDFTFNSEVSGYHSGYEGINHRYIGVWGYTVAYGRKSQIVYTVYDRDTKTAVVDNEVYTA